MNTVAITHRSAVRLWHQHFNLLANDLSTPDITTADVIVKANGKGPLYQAVRNALTNGLAGDATVYLTVDPDPTNLSDWRNRIGAIVNHIETTEHTCECGNPIVTTWIKAERPTKAWPRP